MGKAVSVSARNHLRITKAKLSLWSRGGWESRSLLARRCGRSGCVLEGSLLGEHVRRGVRPPCPSGHFMVEGAPGGEEEGGGR